MLVEEYAGICFMTEKEARDLGAYDALCAWTIGDERFGFPDGVIASVSYSEVLDAIDIMVSSNCGSGAKVLLEDFCDAVDEIMQQHPETKVVYTIIRDDWSTSIEDASDVVLSWNRQDI